MVDSNSRRGRTLRFLAGGVALLASLSPVRAADDAVPAQDVPPSQPWAQSASDLPADPAVRFGTLANGVRYAILHNATPRGEAALWLRIDAGSLMERDDQLGLAHFMEHMAFNGTKHFPKNAPSPVPGANFNAFTNFDQTAFQVNLPNGDDKALDSGVLILRDLGGEALLEPGEIDATRGVVAGEERSANLYAKRVQKAQMAFLYQGLKLPDRLPIGDMSIVRSAQRDRFVDFYDRYYRPARATIIAVGDFDADAMEARIRRTFADWQPKGPAGAAPELGSLVHRGEEASIVVEPGVKPSVTFNWTREPDQARDTRASRRGHLLEELGLAILNRRLSQLSRADDPPFVKAEAATEREYGGAETTSVSAEPRDGGWGRALDAIEQERRRLDQFGVTAVELRWEVAAFRLKLERQAGGAATRASRTLAGELDDAVNERSVFVAPQTELALFESAVNGLSADEVGEAVSKTFTGNGPLITLTSAAPVDGGESAVIEELSRSRQVAVTAPRPPVVKRWPYTDFGKPGAVASRHELPGLGATRVTFANGVTLTVKPTKFEQGDIRIVLLTGAGEQSFPPDRADPRRVLIGELGAGGLGQLTRDDINLSLIGHAYEMSFKTLGDHFALSGATRPQDLRLQMQVLSAYLTDPAFRAAEFNQTKQAYPAAYDLQLAQPASAFQWQSRELLAGGDKRKALLKPEQMAAVSMEGHRAALAALLAAGPVHIAMVGDVTVEQAIRATAGTVGALPRRRSAAPAPGADQRHFPAPTRETVQLRHNGLPSQSLGFVAWPATDVMRDLGEGRRLDLLRGILQVQVSAEIREKLAIAYAPIVRQELSDTFEGYGYLSVSAQTVPDKLPAFFSAVDAIAKALRDEPVPQDVFEAARERLVAKLRRELGTNELWLDLLRYAADRPGSVPRLATAIEDVEAVTPADIQALAGKYLRPETAWKAQVLPSAAAPDVAAGRN